MRVDRRGRNCVLNLEQETGEVEIVDAVDDGQNLERQLRARARSVLGVGVYVISPGAVLIDCCLPSLGRVGQVETGTNRNCQRTV